MKTFLLIIGGVVFVCFVFVCIVIQRKNTNNSSFSKSVTKNNTVPIQLPLITPRLVINKSKRQLMVYSNNQLLRTYRIGLGFNPVVDKLKEGDGATPEGEFYIFAKNNRSNYYLSLGISYPTIEDAQRGLNDKLITTEQHNQIESAITRKTMPPQNTALGGLIYIHGGGSDRDWTRGCVALDNQNMKEVFNSVPVGTKVIIEH